MSGILIGDAMRLPLKDASVQCAVTSPPYWGLRDYGIAPLVWGGDPACEHVWGEVERTPWANAVPGPNGVVKNTVAGHWKPKEHGQWCRCSAWRGSLGLEPTPEFYVDHLVAVFREVRRVLRDDGTLWLNLGDSYNAYNGNAGPSSGFSAGSAADTERPHLASGHGLRTKGLKPKDLVGIPWRVAFALQADGWYLRSDIIWAKPNPMPESVTDRPTRAHEYLFLLSKSATYFYDREAISEPAVWGQPNSPESIKSPYGQGFTRRSNNFNRLSHAEGSDERYVATEHSRRNRRSVWTIATEPYPEAHFATFPTDLVKPCVLAGSRVGDLVLDPFAGSGTVVLVAKDLGRHAIGVDLKPDYCQLAMKRTRQHVLRLTP